MPKNIRAIQFLRFAAALLVAFLHATQAVESRYPGSAPKAYLHVVGVGAAGVHVFFVISGFVMVYTSFAARAVPLPAGTFALRRFLRIYPIYWVYCALYAALALANGSMLQWRELIASLLLWPGYASSIIGPGWSLSYEVYFYLCFTFVLLCRLGARKLVLTMSVYAAVSIVVGIVSPPGHAAVHMVTNPLLAEFVLGAWIAHFTLTQRRVTSIAANALLVLSGAGFIASAMVDYTRLPTALIWGVPSALLVSGLVLHELNGSRFVLIEKLAWLGDSSYSFYLLHIALIQLLLTAAPSQLSEAPILLSLAITSLCCLASVFAYHGIERTLVATLQSRVGHWRGRRAANEPTRPPATDRRSASPMAD